MEDEEQTNATLPDDLVERILARVPFPYVYTARILSKSWRARFEPLSCQDDEEKKILACSFQKHVVQTAATWKTFSPIFMSRNDFIFYDRESREWRKLPTLSFLPRECFGSSSWRMEGAFLLVVGYPEMNVRTSMDFFVVNILTRRWKKLQPPLREFEFCTNLLIPMEGMYKLVVFKDDHMSTDCVACAAQIYNSNLDVWSTVKKCYFSRGLRILSDWANFNGVLYRVVSLEHGGTGGPPIIRRMLGRLSEMTWGLLAFDVNEGTFEVLEMGRTELPLDDGNVGLVVCNGSLLMIVYDMYGSPPTATDGLTLIKIDLERRKWGELTRRNFFPQKYFQKPATDGNSIFFAGERAANGILAYNVQENEWSQFPCPVDAQQQWASEATRRTYFNMYNAPTGNYQWEPVSFQPNLNPFGEV